MRLTNKFIAELGPPGRMHSYSDYVIPRLMLKLQSNGNKFWHLRVETPIGDTTVVIGTFPDLDVTAARKKAHKILERNKGIDDLKNSFKNDYSQIPNAKYQFTLSRITKARHKSNFRPNPMFQYPKKGLTNASKIKRNEQAKRDFLLKSQQQAEIKHAWHNYKNNRNIAVLLKLLRDNYFASNLMPMGMGEELAKSLEGEASDVENKDYSHIFLTYWRHTEFKHNVQPLLVDSKAVDECVAFMEAIGRQIDHDTIKFWLKNSYQKWRRENDEKLKTARRILKDLNSHAGDIGKND